MKTNKQNKATKADISTNTEYQQGYDAAMRRVVEQLQLDIAAYEEEAQAWVNDEAIAKRLRLDRAATLTKLLQALQDSVNTNDTNIDSSETSESD
jgi:hypothetical protein